MSRQLHASEHDFEPQPGLPEVLPAGERLLWQGAPDWRVFARRGLHWRKFAGYFALLAAWRGITSVADGGSALDALVTAGWTIPPAVLALGFIVLTAWLVARTTLYTLTDQRLVMRIGIVLSLTFNLPLARIQAAELRANDDGSGDIGIRLGDDDRIGALHLWPHMRPWQYTRTEPMLRALPDVQPVARMLSEALIASLQADQRTVVEPAATRPQGEPAGTWTTARSPHAA